MKISWRTELPLWILIAGMFALALWSWPSAPREIPVHWGVNGQVDRYGGKFEGLLAMPLIALLIYGLMLGLPRIDPGRWNYPGFAGAYYAIRASILAVLAAIDVIVQLQIRGHGVAMERVIPALIGLLLFVMGSIMGKIRPNWFVGIRTPWTLSSKRSWIRTHRIGGWVFIVGGIALMLHAVITAPGYMIVVAAILGAGVLWTLVYSYLVWRRDPDRVPPAGTMPGEGPVQKVNPPLK